MSTNNEPRRPWFQFSLKSIFVLMLVVAAFFGGMAVKQRQMVEAERARVEAEIQAINDADQLVVLQAIRQWEQYPEELLENPQE
jgi:hypothetical protein